MVALRQNAVVRNLFSVMCEHAVDSLSYWNLPFIHIHSFLQEGDRKLLQTVAIPRLSLTIIAMLVEEYEEFLRQTAVEHVGVGHFSDEETYEQIYIGGWTAEEVGGRVVGGKAGGGRVVGGTAIGLWP